MTPVRTRALSHLCFRVEQSRGRRYPELPHPYRNDFERDRDRVIHTRAFRRLEDKTQVFTAPVSDHFRNRLTHTIEVSQIARTIAATLGLNEVLTEALALAHDVGHPPFAHAGEEELNRQMQRYGDHFDHNLHSLRIVEQFEQRYARFPGLNLTFEVREGIAKHSRDFAPGEIPELEEYLPGLRPPLEAQIIDLADEIAYNAADLDDGFAAQFYSMEDIQTAVPQFAEITEIIDTQFAGAPERIRFQECLRLLIDASVSGLIYGTLAAVESSRVDSVAAVRDFPERLVRLAPAARDTAAALKQFLRERVYYCDLLIKERERSAEMIGELFEFYMQHPDSLPEGTEIIDVPLHRAVCDYIAGMTDGYFRRTYSSIFT